MGAPAGGRFGKRQRLLESEEFDAVFAARRRRADHLFIVFSRDNQGDFGRLGLAVSRKVSRRANVRNRIKRAVRESFRVHQRRLAGLDLVVVARPGAATESPSALRLSLEHHWGKVKRG